MATTTATVESQVRAALRRVEGVLESPGIFSEDDAFWVNGKEIAHFHGDDLELRLTRPVISASRERLSADSRIELRRPPSDWISIHFTSPRDITLIVELAEMAAEAHRPPAGAPAKLPPLGADLARRRRFH